jgi:ornithine--oxo-acid transaminase
LAERLCKRFGYDKVVAAVSGSEATDTAVKIARKWGIVKKGIPASEALIFGVGDSFHGLTSGVWNLQNSTKKRSGETAMMETDPRLTLSLPRVWVG